MNPFKWRKMTWLIWIFTALMLAWIAAGVSETSDNCDQYSPGTSAYESCQTGTEIGTGLGVTLLFFVWFVGFIILSIIWFMTRGSRRSCPVCGSDVKKGKTTCKKCGYDFASGASAQRSLQ